MFRYLLSFILILLLLGGCAGTPSPNHQQLEKQADIHFRLGVDALQKGALPKAFEELMLSDKLRPNQPEVLDALAYAWRLRGETGKADALYRKSLRILSRPETHNNYANLLVELGRYKEAAAQARQALADPRYQNQHLALMNYGDALLGLQEYDKAIKQYRLAASLRPDNAQPLIKEAHAYALMQHPDYAIALLESLNRQYPDRRDIVEMLVMLLHQQGEPEKAAMYLTSFRDRTANALDRAWANDLLGQWNHE